MNNAVEDIYEVMIAMGYSEIDYIEFIDSVFDKLLKTDFIDVPDKWMGVIAYYVPDFVIECLLNRKLNTN